MTNDDRFDDTLREAARDYNAPPASVPRDEMWERIAAARAARRAGGGGAAAPEDEVTRPAPDVVVLPVRRRRWQSAAWVRALAAALLLAVGVGVGRLTAKHDASPDSPRAVATAGTPNAATPPSAAAPDSSTPAVAPRSAQLASTTGGATRDRAPSASPDPRPPTRAPADDAESREPTAESSPLPYRLAAAEHLALTETLLTTVSADARAGRADSSVSLWARDLLGTTRMLLDSPAARDPKMARLLEDLELVLAEVAQLRPAHGSGAELQAIDRAVRQRGVLTRLRATMPAGPLSAGT